MRRNQYLKPMSNFNRPLFILGFILGCCLFFTIHIIFKENHCEETVKNITKSLEIELITPSDSIEDSQGYVIELNIPEDTLNFYKSIPIHIPVTITAYNPLEGQTDSTPFITASNTRVKSGICAVSSDLEEILGLKFGDVIGLNINGKNRYLTFKDRMNKRMKLTIDIFLWEEADAKQFGVKKGLLFPKKPALFRF